MDVLVFTNCPEGRIDVSVEKKTQYRGTVVGINSIAGRDGLERWLNIPPGSSSEGDCILVYNFFI